MTRPGVSWLGLFLSLLVGTRAVPAQNQPVRLLAETTVKSEDVWLSDLLPSSAAPALVTEARNIYLGHAPQATSFRVFTAAQLERAAHGKIEIDAPEHAIVHRFGWALNAERIRGIIGDLETARGLDLSQSKLLLPLGFITLTSDPELEVVQAGRSTDRTLVARIRCRIHANCTSFLSQIVFEEPLLSPKRGVRTALPTPASSVTAQVTSLKSAVQPGRAAWLLIESDGMRIRERVFPLSRGRQGETVQVLSGTGRRPLLAEVVGDGLLRPKPESPPTGTGEAKK